MISSPFTAGVQAIASTCLRDLPWEAVDSEQLFPAFIEMSVCGHLGKKACHPFIWV